MDIVKELSLPRADEADSFPGFLTALIYSGLDVDFAQFVREAWRTLDHVSGQTMLVLVPPIGPPDDPLDASFLPPLKRAIRNIGYTSYQIFKPWPSDGIGSDDEPGTRRIEEFGLDLQQVPCLLTLASVRETYAYRFSFPYSERNKDWKDWYIKIFKAAEAAYKAELPPSGATKEQMIQWRRGRNPLLEEALTNAMVWKTTKKIASKVPFFKIGEALLTGH
jgi:hypothetical protein